MTPEDAFLEDVREHPDDDAPRLIFADWLDDHGDADRAEFIRGRVYRARLRGRESPEVVSLSQRAAELLSANWRPWTEPLGRLLGDAMHGLNWPRAGYRPEALSHFPRGFVESAEMTAWRFAEAAEELFTRHPIRQLSLHQAADAAARLAARPELAWVEALAFSDYYRAPLDARGMAELARSPHLGRLVLLNLYRNHLGDEGAAALATADWLGGVRSLALTDNGLSWRGAEALARTRTGFRPERLVLDANAIGDEGAIALAGSPILGRVKVLSLAGCSVGLAGVSALAESPHLGEGRSVNLSGNDLTAEARAIIERAPWGRGAQQ
jgi:uncharacterized protein (TIGR02996 family)